MSGSFIEVLARLDGVAHGDEDQRAIDAVSSWVLYGEMPPRDARERVSALLFTVLSHGLVEQMVNRRLEGLTEPLRDIAGGEWSDELYDAAPDLLDALCVDEAAA